MAQPHPLPTGEAPGLSPFESLPFDVILSITSHLDYLTVLRLSLTNTRLHSSLHPDALVPRSVKADFLQHVAESYPQHRHSLTCFRCLRILPRLAFADTHRAGRKGKHSSYPEKQRLRFCHDCGVEGLLYPDMRGFRVNGVRHWLCHACGICTPTLSHTHHPQPSPPPTSNLERLPPPLLQQILTHLPPPSILALHYTSSRLRTAIPHPRHVAPILERYLHLTTTGGRAPANSHPCFGCFRHRNRASFTERQRDDEVAWRRRCMACLQLFYGVGRDTEEGREARERFERQGWCDLCRCLRVIGEGERCEGCVVFGERIAAEEEMRAERREVAGRDFFAGNDGGGDGDVYVPAAAWYAPGGNGGYVDYVDFLFGEEDDGVGREGMAEEVVEEHGVEEPAQPPPVRFRPEYPGDEDGRPPTDKMLKSIEIWLTYKSLLGATVSTTVAVAVAGQSSAASGPAREALRLVSSRESQAEVGGDDETEAVAAEVRRPSEDSGSRRRSWLLALLGRRKWRTLLT